MDIEAGAMVERSYREGLDVGPVVFWEHPKYDGKVRGAASSILS